MKYIYLYILSTFLFVGCQSINVPFKSTKQYSKNFEFHDDENHTFTINSFNKDTNKTQYILLIESQGGTSALEEDQCGWVLKMSFPEDAKYCFQLETSLFAIPKNSNLIIIDAFEYPSSIQSNTFKTTTETARKLRGDYKGFRVTLMKPDGTIIKQSNEVIWPNTLKSLIE